MKLKTLLINCDRCEQKIEEEDVRQYTEKDFHDRLITRFDLCKSCGKELDEWLKSKIMSLTLWNPEG